MKSKWGSMGEGKIDDDHNLPEIKNIEVHGNNVYFYNEVDFESALKVNKTLHDLSIQLINMSKENGFGRPVIKLHINCYGGFIDAGVSIMDTILSLRKDVDIYTYVEGAAASAATFISIVGTKRFITRHSRMLIHQLSAMCWGKYRDLKDDIKNHENLMAMIKEFYKEFTQVPMSNLDEILEHDIWWDANKCLELKLVDEII